MQNKRKVFTKTRTTHYGITKSNFAEKMAERYYHVKIRPETNLDRFTPKLVFSTINL